LERTVRSGQEARLDAGESRDPDGQPLHFRWLFYPEVGTYRGALPEIRSADSAEASFTAPAITAPLTLHALLMVTDTGTPALTRYGRVIVTVKP
jgi:hypothetical protein